MFQLLDGRSLRWLLLVVGALSLSPVAMGQLFIGPSPYLCQDDSPWAAHLGSPDFFLETFEDAMLNTPGVSGNGSTTGPGGITDSVDCDDGVINGVGQMARSYFGSGSTGIILDFNAAAFGGQLPRRVGIVWTDGVHNSTPNSVHFAAFGPGLAPLGEITGSHPDSNVNSGTAEDRFYGIEYGPGISRIRIYQTAGCCGIEVDHLQYGGPAFCPCDWNGVDGLDSQDFFDFIEDFAAGSADFNGFDGTDSQDFFDFSECFFTGCE